MSRKKSASGDSLDLLLDTICNTFGGVLFIAILVIILLNMSGDKVATTPPDETAREKMASAQAALAEAQTELERLRRVSSEQAKLVAQFADPKVKDLLSSMTNSQSVAAATAATSAANLQSAAEKQEEINRIASDMAALEAALAHAQKQLTAVESQLQQERELRTRTVNLPKQKQTTKDQIAFLLQGGKLYSYMRVGTSGNPEQDSRDTQHVKVGTDTFIDVMAGGGVNVNPAGDSAGTVAQKFSGWNSSQHFIAVAVWPDSFEHFPAVRQILVEKGFEYQLLPMQDGTKVLTTDSPINRLVQ